jgi:hypothetical protein
MIALFATLVLVSDPGPLSAAKPVVPLIASPPTLPQAKLSDHLGRCQGFTLLTANEGRANLSRLGNLPDANMEVAVNRTVGCRALPLVVRYNVSH